MTGRPSKYSDELLEKICDGLCLGKPLTQICRDLAEQGIQIAPRTVRDWEADAERPEISAAIARAREVGEHAIAEECLSIADDARNDWMEKLDKDGGAIGWQLNGDHVQRSKLRIETRLKLLAKFNPKRWGDKAAVELTGAGGGPVQTVTRVERRIVRPGSGAGDAS